LSLGRRAKLAIEKTRETRGTAQEGGVGREYRGCPGLRLGREDGAGPGNQPAPVKSQSLCLNRPVPAAFPASGSVKMPAAKSGEVPIDMCGSPTSRPHSSA